MAIKKSLYGGAKYIMDQPTCKTVGELIEQLSRLPKDLPLKGHGLKPVWFNVGQHGGPMIGEHLGIEDPLIWE